MSPIAERFRGLRWRLLGSVVAVVTLGQLSWGLVQADLQADRLRAAAQDHGMAMLRATVDPLAVPLANQELTTLDAALARIAETRRESGARLNPSGSSELPLMWVAILDTNGVVMAHTEPSWYGEDWSNRPIARQGLLSATPQARRVQGREGDRLQITMPIESGLRWGTAITEISMVDLETEITQRRHSALLQSLMLGGVVATLLSVLLGLLVVGPITRFSAAAHAISGGELATRVHLEGSVLELAHMAESFNEMARQIQGQTEVLEEQVEARTAELVAVNAQLTEQARTDGLTGLRNHRSFQESLAREITRSERYGQPLSLMMIDVDHFKSYNDTHGHPAGDEVLKTMAQLFHSSLRSTDIVSRYGGEEFAILIINSNIENATSVGEKIIKVVRSHTFAGEEQSQPGGVMTVSIGLANFPTHAADSVELLSVADQALYAAKHDGRDRIHLASSPEAKT